MAKLPAAQPVPRVLRSTRDDRYQAGHRAGSKRATAGWVTSVQDDTVTVTSLGEELPGVIPLGDMPPVGAIVEVESRGNLLVIPVWWDGPLPPAGDIVVMTTVTRGRLVRSAPGYSADDFIDLDDATAIDFYGFFAGPGSYTDSHLYIVEMDGETFPGTTYIPATPPGYDLADVRPWVSAFLTGDPQDPWTGGTVGTTPEPTLKPWLIMQSTDSLLFEDFGTTDPPPPTVCDAADDLSVTGGNWADDLSLGAWPPPDTHIVVTGLGYRFTFSPTP